MEDVPRRVAMSFPYGAGAAIAAWVLGQGLLAGVVAGIVVWLLFIVLRFIQERDERLYGRDDPYDG